MIVGVLTTCHTQYIWDKIWYDIYLTAIGLTPGGSITRHIYNEQYTKYTESTILEVRAVPCLCQLYPDICLTTEGKARKKPQLG